MKKLFFTFLLICSGFMLAQSADEKKILEDSQSFMSMLQQKNYDGMLDMTHPGIFEKVDRNTMSDSFKSLLGENDEFKIEVIDTDKNAFTVSQILKTEDGTKYAFVFYPMKMKMTFLKEKFDDEKKKMMLNMMSMQGMKAQFLNDSALEMSKESMIIALNDKVTKGTWKYLNYDEANPLYVSVVPAEIMTKAKEYYADFLIKQKKNAN
ncbi:MAG: hypothetical protein LBE92_15745 [Chryseobacterium sp.]|jgi:hypothetical protein|uniref:hypothetical protein n=1 Tax=Chryseobacterium sp. TaxID=1871047 RepID=UPI0028213118|nr:hypothetical protein [Chryseobacterium sp.]MDR2237574.1 hypothetical protein [Chryseobacterium sp.]